MRNFLSLLPLAIAGCAAAPQGTPPASTAGTCRQPADDAFVGQPVSEETGAKILAATGARIIRWAAPDMMMTMEYSPERVTVHYGTDRRIGKVVCG
jgi:hypothetical protein